MLKTHIGGAKPGAAPRDELVNDQIRLSEADSANRPQTASFSTPGTSLSLKNLSWVQYHAIKTNRNTYTYTVHADKERVYTNKLAQIQQNILGGMIACFKTMLRQSQNMKSESII